MIPKIIHYCWFGKGEYSDLTRKCIASWKKFLPDYQIIEWNEENVSINDEIPYVKEAYHAGKYAFVSDYIRLKALYEYGGIYFDTDYEIIKPIENLLIDGDLITGFESKETILTAIIAAEKNSSIIKEFINTYLNRHFLNEDGSFDTTPINDGFSELLKKHGVSLERNEYQNIDHKIVIYSIDILCGFDVINWHEKLTIQTQGVHHMSNSWASDDMKKHIRRIQLFQRILGIPLYDKVKKFFK